ncbi:ABC transporter substrate-binding protein [Geodermatophilus sp. DSM 44513]|uniref:ABC transporter substrate-binding protein n=1 Tax=Geodermatophilus sp. DSM 44513 TaxID=1528104 RepID=UPI001277C54E|nr:ABC transporter substrate-binding protein [Geodermatophilus sp. DSM 44513]WNV77092.1 ABC transporter substrate-binding protein [Geodermatophilus sp. DSM 44513]
MTVLLALGVLLLAACGQDGADPAAAGSDTAGSGGESGTGETVTLAVPIPTPYYALPSFAEQQGLFDENGVDVEVQYVQPGALSPALAGGSLDYAVLPGPALHDLRLQGSDVLAVANYIDRPMVALTVGPDITSIEDLRGRSVTVGVPTSLSTIFMRQVLRDAGLDPDADVTTRVIPDQPGQFSALVTGQVDAAMLSLPQTEVAQQQGMRVLLDLADSDYTWPFAAIATRAGYAEENAEQTVALLRALVAALERWQTEPEAAKQVIAETSRIDDPALLDASYAAVSAVLTAEPVPTEEVMGVPLEVIAAGGEDEAAEADPADFFETRYIEEALG